MTELSLDTEAPRVGLDSAPCRGGVWEQWEQWGAPAGGSREPSGHPYFVYNCVSFMDIGHNLESLIFCSHLEGTGLLFVTLVMPLSLGPF